MQIKYRQRHKTDPAKDHYWGVIDGEWVSSINVLNPKHCMYWVSLQESEQFTGKLDKAGAEIYEGDEVKGVVYQLATWGLLWRKIKRLGPRRKFSGTVFFDDIWYGWSVGTNNIPMKGLFEIDGLEVIGRVKK